MKVLIVEDQITIQSFLIEQLKSQLGIAHSDIVIANNGLEAIKIASKTQINLVLMDIHMPVMDGITATEKLSNKYSQLKIIIISSFDDKLFKQKAMIAGAKAYLFKEHIETDLSSIVQNVAGGYKVFPESTLQSTEDQSERVLNSQTLKILKTNKSIAAEIIRAWIYERRNSHVTQESFFDFLDIDLRVKEDVINSLDRDNKVEELKITLNKKARQFNLIDLSKKEFINEVKLTTGRLNIWLNEREKDLQINAQVLRIKLREGSKKFIEAYLSNMSPMPSFEYLEKLEKSLFALAKDYEKELKKIVQIEQSAKLAYKNLLVIFHQNKLIEKERLAGSLILAWQKIYGAKVTVKAYKLAVQIILGMIRFIQFYIDDLIQTNNLLKNVLNDLNIDDTNSSIYINRKELIHLHNPVKLLQDVEKDLGHHLNQWGIYGTINSDLIIDLLLNKL
jgi:DNA-binding NarL/FixJ family response regulator